MATDHAVESVDATPPWRRLGRGTVVPILLLLGLLFVLGQLHVDLAQGYTVPRLIADAQGGYAFWDEGGSEPTFCLRESLDGSDWTRKRRVPGILAGVALSEEQVFALHAGGEEPGSWFCRVSSRKELEPIWTRTFADPELGLHHPRHLASVGEQVHAFGSDRTGALRVVRVGKGQQLLPVAVQLVGAAIAPLSSDVTPPAPDKVPPPVGFASARDGEGLVLAWRVLEDPTQGRQSKGELRWARFDGNELGPMGRAPEDLAAFALVRTRWAGSTDERLLLLGVPPGDREPRIKVWELGADGFQARSEVLDYPREGFAGQAGLAALALTEIRGRLIVLAQIGGAIRWRSRDLSGQWGPWEDFARLPAEQRAVVYGWFGSILFLCAALVWQGWRLWRGRRPRSGLEARASGPPAKPAHASLLERGLAFAVDGLLLIGVASVLLAPALSLDDVERSDPRRQLSLAVLALAAVVVWLAVWEGLARRTPGKWLLGLEVADQDGGQPAAWSLVMRNLFRIELLLPPLWLAGLVTLMVMLATPRHQRPGDLVARTVVVRSGARGEPLPA